MTQLLLLVLLLEFLLVLPLQLLLELLLQEQDAQEQLGHYQSIDQQLQLILQSTPLPKYLVPFFLKLLQKVLLKLKKGHPFVQLHLPLFLVVLNLAKFAL